MKVKKEFVSAIKDTLKCYPLLISREELLKEQLMSLKNHDGLRGVNYDGERIKSNNIHKATEQTALNYLDKEKEIIEALGNCSRQIYIIKAAIHKLPKDQSEIIFLRFIDGLSWVEVEDVLFISERTGRSRVSAGLESLAIIFYGKRAMKDCGPGIK